MTERHEEFILLFFWWRANLFNRVTSDGTMLCRILNQKNIELWLYQILKLHIQVLADGELCVWYSLVKVCVQVMEHLHNEI